MSFPDFNYKQLVVHITDGSGEKLRFRADNIIIEDKNGKILLQHTCHRIFALFILGEISVTSVLIKHCVMYHFPIILMNRSFRVVAKFNCEAEGNTLLRQKQYKASAKYNLEIAKALIFQKILNQTRLIEKIRKKSMQDKNAIECLKSISLSDVRDNFDLMGREGMSSRLFFSAYFRLLNWQRREPRCKRDIPNLLLDIGYTWLFQFVEALLSLYGFDLYCGVLHTFFYQRKSLVCDIIEPFRCIIDERIRKAYNLKQIDADDFGIRDGMYFLKYNCQKKYAALFLIMYDIENDKTRTRFSKFLSRYGRRLQYSVFQIENSPRILENVKIKIKEKYESDFNQGDSVLIYRIPDDSCVAKFGYPVNEETDLVLI